MLAPRKTKCYFAKRNVFYFYFPLCAKNMGQDLKF